MSKAQLLSIMRSSKAKPVPLYLRFIKSKQRILLCVLCESFKIDMKINNLTRPHAITIQIALAIVRLPKPIIN